MINNTFELLWRDISPFSVGFDRTIDTLSLLANSKQTSNYPPYNIRKISEEQYTIEVAVAGFEESEIDIEAVADIEVVVIGIGDWLDNIETVSCIASADANIIKLLDFSDLGESVSSNSRE